MPNRDFDSAKILTNDGLNLDDAGVLCWTVV